MVVVMMMTMMMMMMMTMVLLLLMMMMKTRMAKPRRMMEVGSRVGARSERWTNEQSRYAPLVGLEESSGVNDDGRRRNGK